jgi:hypothetical protein
MEANALIVTKTMRIRMRIVKAVVASATGRALLSMNTCKVAM